MVGNVKLMTKNRQFGNLLVLSAAFRSPFTRHMVHAGVLPAWTVDDTMQHAAEAEAALQSPHYREFFAQMYGNAPVAWDAALHGVERLRVIVNAFTRLRYCSAAGEME